MVIIIFGSPIHILGAVFVFLLSFKNFRLLFLCVRCSKMLKIEIHRIGQGMKIHLENNLSLRDHSYFGLCVCFPGKLNLGSISALLQSPACTKHQATQPCLSADCLAALPAIHRPVCASGSVFLVWGCWCAMGLVPGHPLSVPPPVEDDLASQVWHLLRKFCTGTSR